MGVWPRRFLALGTIIALGVGGCSDDSDTGSGDGDGDGDLYSGNGATFNGDGDGDGDSPGDGDATGGGLLDPCFGDLMFCSNGCVDLTSNDDHCGRCGERCASDEMCEDSECVEDPSAGGAGGGGGQGGSDN